MVYMTDESTSLAEGSAERRHRPIGFYLNMAKWALKDGRITDSEYRNFEKGMNLAFESPGTEPRKAKVDPAMFDETFSKMAYPFNPLQAILFHAPPSPPEAYQAKDTAPEAEGNSP